MKPQTKAQLTAKKSPHRTGNRSKPVSVPSSYEFPVERTPLDPRLVADAADGERLAIVSLISYLDGAQQAALGLAALLDYHRDAVNNDRAARFSYMFSGGLAEAAEYIEGDLAACASLARGLELARERRAAQGFAPHVAAAS